MKKDDLVFIDHILSCINNIFEYTDEMNKETFLDNKLVKDATIRNFEIIGEATKNISSDIRSKYTDIPWNKMSGMRDKLIHSYMGVDFEIIWITIREFLPDLKNQLLQIINQAKTPD